MACRELRAPRERRSPGIADDPPEGIWHSTGVREVRRIVCNPVKRIKPRPVREPRQRHPVRNACAPAAADRGVIMRGTGGVGINPRVFLSEFFVSHDFSRPKARPRAGRRAGICGDILKQGVSGRSRLCVPPSRDIQPGKMRRHRVNEVGEGAYAWQPARWRELVRSLYKYPTLHHRFIGLGFNDFEVDICSVLGTRAKNDVCAMSAIPVRHHHIASPIRAAFDPISVSFVRVPIRSLDFELQMI